MISNSCQTQIATLNSLSSYFIFNLSLIRIVHWLYVGKNSFSWFGPVPRLTLTDPELIKDALNKMNDFGKFRIHPQVKFIASGIVSHEGERWRKHRKIINPAFHLEKLKVSFLLLDIDLIYWLMCLSQVRKTSLLILQLTFVSAQVTW